MCVAQALPRTEKPPVSDINEGRPVSLRVVNDLVQLRGKEEEIEYGPVRYEVRRTASYYLIACACMLMSTAPCATRCGGLRVTT